MQMPCGGERPGPDPKQPHRREAMCSMSRGAPGGCREVGQLVQCWAGGSAFCSKCGQGLSLGASEGRAEAPYACQGYLALGPPGEREMPAAPKGQPVPLLRL